MSHLPNNDSTPSTLQGPRAARLEERDELLKMINYVFRISTNRPPTIASDWEHVYVPENLANIAVVTDSQKPQGEQIVASTGVWVSEVAMGESRLRVGGINCVGTMPDYRRHGLGAQLMRAADQTMRRQGCQVGLLSTGIANWYRRMGWEEAGTVRSYRLNLGNIQLLPQLPEGQHARLIHLAQPEGEVDEQIIDEIVRLRNEAQLGAVRSAQNLRQLIRARQVQSVVLAGSQDGSASGEVGGATAYLLLHETTVIEWGGAADVVAGLVRATFAMLDDAAISTTKRAIDGGATRLRTLTLQTPGQTPRGQHPLVNQLDAAQIPYSSDYLGMIYVIDPQAILNAYGITSVHIVETDNEFDITHNGQTIHLDRNQLAKFLFGPERISPFAADLFPLAFWQWGIEKV